MFISMVQTVDRRKSDYIASYMQFDDVINNGAFPESTKGDVPEILFRHSIKSPIVAYCETEDELINDMNIFPGSDQFFRRMLTWAFDMRRAYVDMLTYGDTESEKALAACARDMSHFAMLVMEQA